MITQKILTPVNTETNDELTKIRDEIAVKVRELATLVAKMDALMEQTEARPVVVGDTF